MVNVETLYDLFVYELQGIRAAESDLAEMLETLATDAEVDSLDDTPDSEFRDAARELFADHRERTGERLDRLDRAFDAIDHVATTSDREREDFAVDALVREKERFNNVVLDDALRNPYYLDAAIKAEQLVGQCYDSALAVAEPLDVNHEVVDELEANRDDAESALRESRDLDESDDARSLLAHLADETPMD